MPRRVPALLLSFALLAFAHSAQSQADQVQADQKQAAEKTAYAQALMLQTRQAQAGQLRAAKPQADAARAQSEDPDPTPLPAPPPPQTSRPNPTQTTYRIAGTVLSALTGQPIQHASVTLATTRDNKPAASSITDESGRFTFPAVPAGSFELSGEAPGFVRTSFQQHGVFSTAILTGAGVDTESLTLRLRPLGSLSGTITDESAEPIRGAQIHLFHRDHSFGDARILPGRTASTDDLGHYEFPRLQPNTYFVAVIAQPWYALHAPANLAAPQPFGIQGPIDPALDVAYPVTFFPGASDESRAAPIPINGNSARADIQLSPTPALTLTIPHPPFDGPTPQPQNQLQVSLFGSNQMLPISMQQTQTDTVIAGVPPGDYLLRTTPNTPTPGEADQTPIHLSRDAPPAPPNPASHAHVHLTVRAPEGTPPRAGLYAGLVPLHSHTTVDGAPVGPKGTADLNPAPGTYYLQIVDKGSRPLFLRNVERDGKPQPDTTLDLTANSNTTLTVIAVPGTHTLKGILQKDGKPCPGAMLLLVPAEPHPDVRVSFRQQSDLDGSFEIAGLAPGPYLLVALEDAWDLDWNTPAFLDRYLPRSTPILIPDSPAIQTLPRPISVQLP